jgi:hypothetical protein
VPGHELRVLRRPPCLSPSGFNAQVRQAVIEEERKVKG